MEILKTLFRLLFSSDNNGEEKDGADALLSAVKYFSENSFDVKKILSGLNAEKLAPVISALAAFNVKSGENKDEGETFTRVEGLSPVADIADKEVIYCLNRYLADV